MKYQTRLVFAFTTIAFVLSLTLGIVVYKMSVDYEDERRENSLAVTSEQLVSQMEDRLRRMDAIISYILSDPGMLDSIETLGRVSEGTVPDSYVLDAKSELQIGFTTEYIIQNSYRTVFYNQLGDLVSSFNLKEGIKTLGNTDVSKISYLGQATQAKGKSVLVGVHKEEWGETDGPEVYSVMKALQGFQMGYIEVENTVDSLAELKVSDPDADFIILTGEDIMLYSSSEKASEGRGLSEYYTVEDGRTERVKGAFVCSRRSEEFEFRVIGYMPELTDGNGQAVIFITSAAAAFVTFSICLLLIVLWSHALSKPIVELRRLIENTNLENLEVHTVQMGSGFDEIKMLAQSYQAMTERVSLAVENEKRSLMLWMQAQFDTLQAQINPHFLYNVLNIISSRGIEDDDDMICDMCGALAGMLRYSTNNKERYAHIAQEIQYLEHYLYLLKARYGDKISFDIQLDDRICDRWLPRMTLHQFVENTLAHGYSHSDKRMEICISGILYPDRWEICVRDNGEGIAEERLKEICSKINSTREMLMEHSENMELEIGGMGLVNTYARCYLLYKEQLIFSVRNLSTGIEVKIGEMFAGRREKDDVSGTGSR